MDDFFYAVYTGFSIFFDLMLPYSDDLPSRQPIVVPEVPVERAGDFLAVNIAQSSAAHSYK